MAARPGRFYGVAMKAGYLYTIAGPFPGAHDVAVDRHGDILVLDPVDNVIRLIAVHSGRAYGQQVTAGHDYVIAGRSHGHAGWARAARPPRPGSATRKPSPSARTESC